VEPLHLELEDREVYLAKIPVRCRDLCCFSSLVAGSAVACELVSSRN